LTHLMQISWVLMRPAGSVAGSRQAGSQAARGRQGVKQLQAGRIIELGTL